MATLQELVSMPTSGVGGSVLPGDPYFQSPEYRAFQDRMGSGPQIGTTDIYDSPYFGRSGSGSIGRQQDAAYEEYLARISATPTQPPAGTASAGIGPSSAYSEMSQMPVSVVSGNTTIPGGPTTDIVGQLPAMRSSGTGTAQVDPSLRPYLELGLQRAEQLFFGNQQPSMYPGQMYVGPSQQTLDALAAQEAAARASSPVLGAAQSAFLSGIQTPSSATPLYQSIYGGAGMRPGASVYEQAAAGQLAPSTQRFENLYGAAGAGVPSLYGQVAGGGFQNAALPGIANTAYGGFLTGSPYQQALIEASTRPIARQLSESTLPGIQSAFSRAGRYGSGAQTRAIEGAVEAASRAAGDVATQIGAQTYAQERGLQEAALSNLAGLSQQGLQTQLQAAQLGEATRQAQLAQQAGLAGQISALQQQGVATQLAGAGGLEQAQQAALGTQLAAAGGIGSTQAADLQRQLAASQIAPSIYAQQYLPAQALAQVGAQQEQIAQAPLQEAMQRYQYQQTLPYQQLQGFLSSVYGTPLGSASYAAQQPGTNNTALTLGLLGTAASVVPKQAYSDAYNWLSGLF